MEREWYEEKNVHRQTTTTIVHDDGAQAKCVCQAQLHTLQYKYRRIWRDIDKSVARQ